jgi:hypothetical protein
MYNLTKHAKQVLKNNPTEKELGQLFEDCQFNAELEEYLFECMDATALPYVEVIIEELIKLNLLPTVVCAR